MYIYWLQVHYHLLDFIQFLEPFIIKFKTGQIQLMNHVMVFFKITMSKFLLVSNQAFIFASKDKKKHRKIKFD